MPTVAVEGTERLLPGVSWSAKEVDGPANLDSRSRLLQAGDHACPPEDAAGKNLIEPASRSRVEFTGTSSGCVGAFKLYHPKRLIEFFRDRDQDVPVPPR